METEYLVATISLSLFVVLLLIYAVVSYRIRATEWARQQKIEQSLEHPVKMEYDFVAYDEETEKILAGNIRSEGQLTIEDVLGGDSAGTELFAKIDNEGLEEITGKYSPE